MFEDVRVLIAARPFEPFTLRMTGGAEIPVPTVDHIYAMIHLRRFIVERDDNKTYHIIRPEQISDIVVDGHPA